MIRILRSTGCPTGSWWSMLFGPTLDWLPPIARRRYTVAPTPAPPARRVVQASYQRFIRRLYDAGVTIVPGTDNVAFTYIGELEIYEHAGIPAPDVLRIATLIPAQVMDEARDYGSIAAGKVADIIIVDGDPTVRIADLRRIETVVGAGRVYSVRDLYAEVGVLPDW
jgi:imidazolonepropionase-like amidohydrolase